jgi:hypothetical protein
MASVIDGTGIRSGNAFVLAILHQLAEMLGDEFTCPNDISIAHTLCLVRRESGIEENLELHSGLEDMHVRTMSTFITCVHDQIESLNGDFGHNSYYPIQFRFVNEARLARILLLRRYDHVAVAKRLPFTATATDLRQP